MKCRKTFGTPGIFDFNSKLRKRKKDVARFPLYTTLQQSVIFDKLLITESKNIVREEEYYDDRSLQKKFSPINLYNPCFLVRLAKGYMVV
jgi:hypothetical protein